MIDTNALRWNPTGFGFGRAVLLVMLLAASACGSSSSAGEAADDAIDAITADQSHNDPTIIDRVEDQPVDNAETDAPLDEANATEVEVADGADEEALDGEEPTDGDGEAADEAQDADLASDERDAEGGLDAADWPDSGPRPLPPTFVALELDQFPRPAEEACADNLSAVSVSLGESIYDAVESAASGTTVWVEPGTYRERGDEVSAVIINTNNLCLRARDNGVVILEQEAGSYGIGVSADDVVIEGFTLRGFGTNISLQGRTATTQRNITIERVTIEQPEGVFIDGIVAYGDNRDLPTRVATVDGLLVIDSHVEGADLGVSCNRGPCDHWWIENTTVINRPQEEGSGADAFAIEDGRQIVVLDSTVSNAGADGIDTKADDVVVYGTRVIDVGRNAIKLWRGGDVINTLVDGSGADACLVGDETGRYRYLHVLIAHHGWPNTGAYVGTWGYDRPDDDIQLEIVNSLFFENSAGGLYVPAAEGVIIRNSIFDDASSKLLDINGTVYLGSDIADLESIGVAEDVQVANPGLENLSDGTYTIGDGSPARNEALPIPGLERDIDGNLRGDQPDIGPIESN